MLHASVIKRIFSAFRGLCGAPGIWGNHRMHQCGGVRSDAPLSTDRRHLITNRTRVSVRSYRILSSEDLNGSDTDSIGRSTKSNHLIQNKVMISQ